MSTSRHSSQTTTTFCPINVSGRSTYSLDNCWRQSVSCCSRSSVEQSSSAHHCCTLSPSSAVFLNHISSHFLILLSDSSLICAVPMQLLIILDTLVVIKHLIFITFDIYLSSWADTVASRWQWELPSQTFVHRSPPPSTPVCKCSCSHNSAVQCYAHNLSITDTRRTLQRHYPTAMSRCISQWSRHTVGWNRAKILMFWGANFLSGGAPCISDIHK